MLNTEYDYRDEWVLQTVKGIRRDIPETAENIETLDDMVHDLASEEAAEVNNGGVAAQLTYLLCRGVTEEDIRNKLCTN